MARFKDPNFVAAAFYPYLQPSEQIRNIAFGVKQPSFALIIPLYLLAIVPGAIATALLTKEYVVALTDRRVIVLRFKSSKIQVQEVFEYALNYHAPAETSTGSLFTHIRINDPAKPFVAKFHRMGMPGNREQAMAIGTALTQPQYPQQYAQQPYPQQQPPQQQQPYQQQYPGQQQ
jgi:hypothetical protein